MESLKSTRCQRLPRACDISTRKELCMATCAEYVICQLFRDISTNINKENILLDANFHCQIADIGLTQNSDAIITLSASGFLFNYAAPELFVTQSESDSDDVLYEGHDLHKGSKTVKTDIYAFGCLYYAVRFAFVFLSWWLSGATSFCRSGIILFHSRVNSNIRSCALSQVEGVRVNWKARE